MFHSHPCETASENVLTQQFCESRDNLFHKSLDIHDIFSSIFMITKMSKCVCGKFFACRQQAVKLVSIKSTYPVLMDYHAAETWGYVDSIKIKIDK